MTRKRRSPAPRSDQPRKVVTLVHGTWARKAPWTKIDSPLSVALTQAGCEVQRFSWSGKNSHHERLRASQELAAYIAASIEKHPGCPHWIVAHSHGGNVAVHAAHKVRSANAHAPKISTIALATPFFHARRRAMTWWSKFWLTLGILAFISLAVTYATADHLGPIGYAVLALAGVSLIELATSLVYLAKSDMPFRRGYAERLIDFVQSPQVPAKTLTVIRAPGDEAAGGLAAGQFVAWTASILNRILSHIGLAAVVTLGVNVAVLVAAWTSSPWLMTTAMEVFGYLLVAVAAVGIFLLGASFIFGLDGPLVGLFATITVDAAPPGKVEIVQVKPYPVNNDATRLIHSELYSDTNIIEAIVQSIAGGRKG